MVIVQLVEHKQNVYNNAEHTIFSLLFISKLIYRWIVLSWYVLCVFTFEAKHGLVNVFDFSKNQSLSIELPKIVIFHYKSKIIINPSGNVLCPDNLINIHFIRCTLEKIPLYLDDLNTIVVLNSTQIHFQCEFPIYLPKNREKCAKFQWK